MHQCIELTFPTLKAFGRIWATLEDLQKNISSIQQINILDTLVLEAWSSTILICICGTYKDTMFGS